MKIRHFNFLVVSFAALILIGTVLCFSHSALAKEKALMLNFGTTQARSSYFPPRLAIAKLINKYVSNVKVTAVESGSTYDNAMRMQEGIFQIGAGGFQAPREQYWGEGKWEGKPWKKVRLFMGLSEGRMLTYVRRDANVKSWNDLTGKRFNPGFMGSAAEGICMRLLDALPEIKPKLVRGTMADTMKSLRRGKIVGTFKASSTKKYDAGLSSVHLKIPLDIIGITEEQTKRVQKRYSHILFGYIKKGQYKESPESGDFWAEASQNGSWVTTDLSEEVVYKMVKAVYEHYDEVVKTLAAAGWVDPIKMITETAAKSATSAYAPLHAGVVRYCKEIGIEVPQCLIPPEYK